MKWIDEVLAIALERPPEPLDDEAYLDGSAAMGKSEETDSESSRRQSPQIPLISGVSRVDRGRRQE